MLLFGKVLQMVFLLFFLIVAIVFIWPVFNLFIFANTEAPFNISGASSEFCVFCLRFKPKKALPDFKLNPLFCSSAGGSFYAGVCPNRPTWLFSNMDECVCIGLPRPYKLMRFAPLVVRCRSTVQFGRMSLARCSIEWKLKTSFFKLRYRLSDECFLMSLPCT